MYVYLVLPLPPSYPRRFFNRYKSARANEMTQAFGGLVEHCFTSCVDDFSSKSVSAKENGCVNRCVLKWMATQQRVSDRFQEHSQQMGQAQGMK